MTIMRLLRCEADFAAVSERLIFLCLPGRWQMCTRLEGEASVPLPSSGVPWEWREQTCSGKPVYHTYSENSLSPILPACRHPRQEGNTISVTRFCYDRPPWHQASSENHIFTNPRITTYEPGGSLWGDMRLTRHLIPIPAPISGSFVCGNQNDFMDGPSRMTERAEALPT